MPAVGRRVQTVQKDVGKDGRRTTKERNCERKPVRLTKGYMEQENESLQLNETGFAFHDGVKVVRREFHDIRRVRSAEKKR